VDVYVFLGRLFGEFKFIGGIFSELKSIEQTQKKHKLFCINFMVRIVDICKGRIRA
jgi:hypothetical protein